MKPMRNDRLFRLWRGLLGLISGVSIYSAEIIQVTRAWAQSPRFEVAEATIPELQAAMAAGLVTSRDLTTMYLARIEAYDQRGPELNAISVTDSAARDEAAKMDAERRTGKLRGLLHGIPVIVKDNYETANMQTADGSASLKGWIPPDDAYLVRRLREAGAIIIPVGRAGERVLPSQQISPPWEWAQILAARSGCPPRVTVSLASAEHKVWPVVMESSHCLILLILVGRLGEA
jgi:Amidase